MTQLYLPRETQRRSDLRLFARAWLRNPRQISAVAPSSRALAELITRHVEPSSGPVLELGPGTGVFTRALLGRGVHESDLILVESDPRFAAALRTEFPLALVHGVDAARLADVGSPLTPNSVASVVSGLPLLSIAEDVVRAILSNVARILAANGALYQFTYGPRCPVPARLLHDVGLTAQRVGTVVCNLPPASVYRISPA